MAVDDGLRPIFRSNLPRFDWQSIESGTTGGGIPDSNACGGGVEFWIEFKATKTNKIKFRPEQVGWLLRRSRFGGRTFVGVRFRHDGGVRKGAKADRLYLFPGSAAKSLAIVGLRCNEVLGFWDGGPSYWNWREVAKILQE